MTENFHDHFSAQAAAYSEFRPSYPAAMFEYLASLTSSNERAWDCATGSGQAAVGLAAHFDRVIATDASTRQIANAQQHHNVRYLAALAERSPFHSHTMDLVLIAQALHWFDLDAFYREVRRIGKPGAVVAACSYNLLRIDRPTDRLLDELYRDILGPFWPPERRMVEDGYGSLAFPFPELSPPELHLQQRWSYPSLLGYLGTWSAVRRYQSARGTDPVARIADRLRRTWGPPDLAKRVRWPLALRVGRL